MEFWRAQGKQAAYSQLMREVAANEAVREAEEVLGSAWLATLSAAEEQAAAARRISTEMRDAAYETLRAAEAGGDGDLVAARRRELAASQQALVRVRRRHEGIHRFVGEEHVAWATAAEARSLDALADRDRLVRAARGVGFDLERLDDVIEGADGRERREDREDRENRRTRPDRRRRQADQAGKSDQPDKTGPAGQEG